MKYSVKRIIAVICVLCMLPIFNVSANTFESEKDLYKYEIAVDFLEKLEVLKETDSLYLKAADEKVTRGEFAVLAYRALNDNNSYNGEDYFLDISENSSVKTAVNSLAKLGVIKGTSAKRFNPNDEISVSDAAAIMLRIMGYNNYNNRVNIEFVRETCVRYKVLPYNYIRDSRPVKSDILYIYYNLLSSPMLDIVGLEENDGEILGNYGVKGNTILSTYFSIYTADGILTADKIMDVMGTETDDSRIYVDNHPVVATEYINIPAGASVRLYYTNKDKPHLYAIYLDDECEIVQLSTNDKIDFLNSEYTYTENGKTKSIRVNMAEANFLHNYSLLTSSDKSFLVPDYGTVTLIDNNSDGKFDVISIKEYDSFVVKYVSRIDNDITLVSDAAGSILISKNEPCKITDTKGNTILADEIAENMTVSCVTVTKNGKKYAKEVIVSDDTADGYISNVKSENSQKTMVVIDGAEYNVYHKYTKLQRLLNPGDEVLTYYLDFLGNIIDVSAQGVIGNVAVGYVVDMAVISETFDTKVGLKIYDEIGRLHTYYCNKSVIIDGTSEKANIYSTLIGKGIIGEVVLFKINKEQRITYIDTPEADATNFNTNNRLVKMADGRTANSNRGLYYEEKISSFGGRVNIDESTMIMCIPTEPQNATVKDFALMTKEELLSNNYYQIRGYSSVEDSPISNIAIITGDKKVKGYTFAAVVNQVIQTLDKDGELSYALELYDNTGKHEYMLKSPEMLTATYRDYNNIDTTGYTIEAGDVVRYSVNDENVIQSVALCYDRSADTLLTGMNFNTSFTQGSRVFDAVPYSIQNGYLKIADPAKSGSMNTVTENDCEYIAFNRIEKTYRVSLLDGQYVVDEISPSDIKNYKTDGITSKIYISVVNRNKAVVFVYEGV